MIRVKLAYILMYTEYNGTEMIKTASYKNLLAIFKKSNHNILFEVNYELKIVAS